MARRIGPRAKPAAVDVLDRLVPHEVASVLRSLLQNHPELRDEAQRIATADITKVDVEALGDEVEDALACVSEESFEGRAGRHSWGYVSPGDTACELLDEALDPYIEDIRRLVQLGQEEAALATCLGVLLGLQRVESRKEKDGVLEWAPDFASDAAENTIDVLLEENRKKHGRRWKLPLSFLEKVPARWQSWIRQCVARRK